MLDFRGGGRPAPPTSILGPWVNRFPISLRTARKRTATYCLGIGLLAILACGDDITRSVELPEIPGVLREVIPPEGFEGPLEHSIVIGFAGELTRAGFALGHLPPEAGDLSRASLLWIGCYIRETSEDGYVMIERVEGSPFPCGVIPHDDHLDVVIESQRDRKSVV